MLKKINILILKNKVNFETLSGFTKRLLFYWMILLTKKPTRKKDNNVIFCELKGNRCQTNCDKVLVTFSLKFIESIYRKDTVLILKLIKFGNQIW